ncbi:MAG: cupin domain-containing protein [Desulfovibrionaceae bacterium]
MNAKQIIELLRLTPHPEEGGFFSETYRCAEGLEADVLPGRYCGSRSFGTAIYYLLTPETMSALHRLQSDEMFHWYAGGSVRMLHLYPDGRGAEVLLGNDLASGQRPQVLVPRGVWQGACLEPGAEYALLGCTVAPGFAYEDYEHGRRSALTSQYPDHAALIARLTTEENHAE